jgi:chromosome segregation ATPase
VGRIGLKYGVFKAALEELLATGGVFTYESLREKTGGGSNSTIGRYYDQWCLEQATGSLTSPAVPLPDSIGSSIASWLNREIDAMRIVFDQKIKEQFDLRESLEKYVDELEDQLAQQTTLASNLTVANERLIGRIEQVQSDLLHSNASNLSTEQKVAAADIAISIAEMKLDLANTQHVEMAGRIIKIKEELDSVSALERHSTDAATRAETQLVETKIQLEKSESREREHVNDRTKYEEKIMLLETLLENDRHDVGDTNQVDLSKAIVLHSIVEKQYRDLVVRKTSKSLRNNISRK